MVVKLIQQLTALDNMHLSKRTIEWDMELHCTTMQTHLMNVRWVMTNEITLYQ